MNEGALELAIGELVQPINGLLPRPWMTDLTHPSSAQVFIVGRNQKNGYAVGGRVTYNRHVYALFNRNGQSCRGLYNEVTGGSPSPTRVHTDEFRTQLAQQNVTAVLETNVICYSSPMSSDLSRVEHRGGRARGTEIFSTLLRLIRPRVVIAHGAGTLRDLSKLMDATLPVPPESNSEVVYAECGGTLVFPVQSLAPPAWNRWSTWAREYLAKVAEATAHAL